MQRVGCIDRIKEVTCICVFRKCCACSSDYGKQSVGLCVLFFSFVGPVSLSTPAQLVAPCVVVKGTLSITTSEVYFEVDEEEPSFKKMDPKVTEL